MHKIIDLRSDTVTKPSKEMRKAMSEAEVGDDVYKEDPTVNELQEYAAGVLGKESSLFVPSGLMGNQICLNILTRPGDEIICERSAHIFEYESGTPAKLSGIQLNLIDGSKGVIYPDQVEKLIRPESAYYMPRTRLIEVENTHNCSGGTIFPIDVIMDLRNLADKYNLLMHLDGARLWNASVATSIPIHEYTKNFDTVSCCLSKGLGAPIGSIIAGTKDLMNEAFRVRKAIGGGMRQVGVIAAAGLYALKNNISRLHEDHDKAKIIAFHLAEIEEVEIDLDRVQTNIVIFKPKIMSVEKVLSKCREQGLLLGPGGVDVIRLVTHLDVSYEDVDSAKEILSNLFL
ncbi:threonine aldolase family protein [Bacteroidota bacterium]